MNGSVKWPNKVKMQRAEHNSELNAEGITASETVFAYPMQI